MKDLASMTGLEMDAKRDITENEVSGLLGRLVFAYSRFVTGLHLCVAWHNHGKDLDNYGAIADDIAVADLLSRIEKQAYSILGENSAAFKKYKRWLRQAHKLRETRNIIMHSRWGIEPYGRHAIAVSTPVLVKPAKEHAFTADRLRNLCDTSETLIEELNQLREKYPL